MKVRIDVAITRDRLTAHMLGKDLAFDEPNRVAVVNSDGRDRLAAIGTDVDYFGVGRVVEGVAVDSFDPALAGALVGYLGMVLWDRLHPGWRGPLALLDNVEVRVSMEDYAEVPSGLRREFIKALPYNPKLTWWVEGEEVRN